ncbi:hypothetical protein SISNIDRAFT_467726 [Sistotremastrum niveocremeum HHB9708]|uniref:Uncharacterized protein n=1 Tax=Sistotremastrum niveocremeum HHB9708 TaxID=1314777 RepID=A0A164SHE8_9AGAM|nr:hypothetical protein SISNIDRAFT_467726 [Sistotremastrum niveocremeum HHB9708]
MQKCLMPLLIFRPEIYRCHRLTDRLTTSLWVEGNNLEVEVAYAPLPAPVPTPPPVFAPALPANAAAGPPPPPPPPAPPVAAIPGPEPVPVVVAADPQPNGLVIGPYPWTASPGGAYVAYKKMVSHLPPFLKNLAVQSVPVRPTNNPEFISANFANVPGAAVQVADAWKLYIGGARRDAKGVSFIPVIATTPPAGPPPPPLTADQATALFEAAQAL